LRSIPPTIATPKLKNSTQTSQTQLYLLKTQNQLVDIPTKLNNTTTTPSSHLTKILNLLAHNPNKQQQTQNLNTTLNPKITIELHALINSIAQIQIQTKLKNPSTNQLPLTIKQLVLSTTSIHKINTVQLIRNNTPIKIPLPNKTLTSTPLTQTNYTTLLTP